jgi:Transposase DDE domain
MERELWPLLYRELQAAAADFRQKYVHHQPWAIAAVLLWAALHERTVTWACQRRHWSTTPRRPARLPSQPTVSRRARKAAFGLFLNLLTARLRGAGLPALVVALDGKPLLVGGASKDPDARFGRAAGHLGKGYKLHAAWGGRPMPEAWEVRPLNEHEVRVAERLVGQLVGGGYLVADGNYDATALFDRAGACGWQLVAAQRDQNPGCGHHYQSPYRLRCIALLGAPFGARFGRALLAQRTSIERDFGNAVAFAGGLGALPAWVRRQRRVELWVWAKLAINAIRIRRLQGLPA